MTQKITLLTIESLTELTSVHQPPCLSLYQPTHRRHPENQQDPIRFRNLVKELETALRQKYPAVETRLLVEPFEDVARDHAFWNHTLDVLAIVQLSRATYRKMIENLLWATGYNAFAIPLAAGALYAWGVLLTPALGAVLMSASTVIVAINARLLRLKK